MLATGLLSPTLAHRLLGDRDSLAARALLAVGGSVALWASAKAQIPFYPVPLTLQTLVVLVIGMTFGARLAGATLILYLLQGAMGLPVFAGTPDRGIGLAYMAGPTGGYLLGYLLAAVTVGALAERGWDRRLATTVAALLLGNLLIYVPGVLWLGTVIGWDKPVLDYGLWPFLYGDALKLALGAALLPGLWALLGDRPR